MLLQSYFPKTGITGDTIVHLHEEDYLGNIAAFLTDLWTNPKTKADAPRFTSLPSSRSRVYCVAQLITNHIAF